MNKNELIKALSIHTGHSVGEVGNILAAFMDIITEEINNGKSVGLLGFGCFRPWRQNERLGRNPKTGEPTQIRERISVKFKPGKFLLEKLNKNNEQ